MRTKKSPEKMQHIAVVPAEILGALLLVGQPIFRIIHLKDRVKRNTIFM